MVAIQNVLNGIDQTKHKEIVLRRDLASETRRFRRERLKSELDETTVELQELYVVLGETLFTG